MSCCHILSFKDFLKRNTIRFCWNLCVAAFADTFLLLIAVTNFVRDYVIHVPTEIQAISDAAYFNKSLFYIDFFVFFTFFVIFLFILLFWDNFYVRSCSLIISTAAAVLLGYTIGELFTIKLFIFCSWILTVGIVFPAKTGIPLMIAGSTAFAVAQYHPACLGIVDSAIYVSNPDRSSLFTLYAYMSATGIFSTIYRHAILQWEHNHAVMQHLNMIMTQMSQFNQKLQDVAKKRGEEAAQQERMRITRDMHDSCGYVFVNIVGLMEAAESSRIQDWSKTRETIETVRTLASRGLQETRRTLHALRAIENPIESSISALYEIKKLFESVTNIKVDLDKGNIQKDYGRTVNSILVRTMQEALTNAVRHGRASQIAIFFWDDRTTLTMTVKDNGVGSKQIVKGIGLAGMEERLSKVGGTLETESPAEGGFRLTIKIPLMEEEEKV